MLVDRVQKRIWGVEKRVERRRIREEEAAGVRRFGRRPPLRGPIRHREIEHREQNRGELRVHSAKPELSVPGGGGSELRQTPDPIDRSEQGSRARQR